LGGLPARNPKERRSPKRLRHTAYRAACNHTETARILGTTERIVQYKVKLYGIDYGRFRVRQ